MTYPRELAHLPAVIRKAVQFQCAGDWRRVTVDKDGSIIVHNRAHKFGLGTPKPAETWKTRNPPVVREKEAPPVPRPSLSPLTPGTIRPISSTKAPRFSIPEPHPDPEERQWILLPGFTSPADWTGQNFEKTAFALRDHVAKGVGMDVTLGFHKDVTTLNGVDLVDVESVVRQCERVDVAPQTAAKGYPILRFRRGDVMVVVGFRNPALPMIIAAYWQALRLPDSMRYHDGRTGGGGIRKTDGLPKNPAQLLARLRAVGAQCESPTGDKTMVMVTFDGQELGRINVGPTATKTSCESDYQRSFRKIDGIRRRRG